MSTVNQNLFYVGLKGVFCFDGPFPQLCQKITIVTPVINGFGIFGGGTCSKNSLSNTSIYTYSNNTSVSGLVLAYQPPYTSATGIPSHSIFVGSDYGNSVISVYTSIYTYSNNTISQGTWLNNPYSQQFTSAGNAVLGIFGGGSTANGMPSATTTTYTYSNNAVADSGNLVYYAKAVAASGNSTTAIFGGGITDLRASVNTSKYLYSSSSALAGTNLMHGTYALASAANSTVGVFGEGTTGGVPSSNIITTSVYVFSDDTVYASSYISNMVIDNGAATGDSAVGIFGGGYQPTLVFLASMSDRIPQENLGTMLAPHYTSYACLSATSIYNYASGAITQGTNLTYAAGHIGAASSTNIGVIS